MDAPAADGGERGKPTAETSSYRRNTSSKGTTAAKTFSPERKKEGTSRKKRRTFLAACKKDRTATQLAESWTHCPLAIRRARRHAHMMKGVIHQIEDQTDSRFEKRTNSSKTSGRVLTERIVPRSTIHNPTRIQREDNIILYLAPTCYQRIDRLEMLNIGL